MTSSRWTPSLRALALARRIGAQAFELLVLLPEDRLAGDALGVRLAQLRDQRGAADRQPRGESSHADQQEEEQDEVQVMGHVAFLARC